MLRMSAPYPSELISMFAAISTKIVSRHAVAIAVHMHEPCRSLAVPLSHLPTSCQDETFTDIFKTLAKFLQLCCLLMSLHLLQAPIQCLTKAGWRA